jgi:hypothetical protein
MVCVAVLEGAAVAVSLGAAVAVGMGVAVAGGIDAVGGTGVAAGGRDAVGRTVAVSATAMAAAVAVGCVDGVSAMGPAQEIANAIARSGNRIAAMRVRRIFALPCSSLTGSRGTARSA